MSNQAAADMVAECERLARAFGRLADVDGAIVTERWLTLSRRPRVRVDDYPRFLRKQAVAPGFVCGNSKGVELGDVPPQTAEEWESAPMWYVPLTGEPVVNSVGQSLVLKSGWASEHEYELSGARASRAVELLRSAGVWTANRWGVLSRLLWPGRGSVATDYCWPDVVNRVAELAHDATLPRPNWCVIVGKYRAWWPVEMWKTRDDWQLGEPRYTPEDVERIGDDPEVVWAKREQWLQDSETALEWLAKQLMGKQPVAPEPEGPVDGLSDDGLTLRWGGRLFAIKPTAALVIGLLVDSFNRGFPYLSEDYLKTEAETQTDMRTMVRDGLLTDVVIREVGPDGKNIKGKWGLIDPKKILPPQENPR